MSQETIREVMGVIAAVHTKAHILWEEQKQGNVPITEEDLNIKAALFYVSDVFESLSSSMAYLSDYIEKHEGDKDE